MGFSIKHADRQPNGQEEGIKISNLGILALDPRPKAWNVSHLWFAQGRNVTGPALALTVITST